MRKKYLVTLSDAEGSQLRALTRKGDAAGRRITRAQIMLLADEGHRDAYIATSGHVGALTVHQVRRRYEEEGLDAT